MIEVRKQYMKLQQGPSSIARADIEARVRLAGIQVDDQRIPRLAEELASAMRAAELLEGAVSRAPEPGGAPFDPAWEDKRGRGRS